MKKLIKTFKDLPLEIDKIYKTKISNGILFKIIKLEKHNAFGYYVGQEYIGICPLSLERIIADRIEDGEIYVCDKCGEFI